jgi:hypothetical protein
LQASADADAAASSAADAASAASTAQADATAAQAAADAAAQAQADNPQPGQVTASGPSGVADVLTKQVVTGYSFTPTSDCVGTGGCDVTGTFTVTGFNVFLLVSCVTPSSTPDTCINTGSGPQFIVDVLGVVPLSAVSKNVTVHITQQQLLASSLKALPGELFGEYIGCAKLLTGNGGSLGDCGWVVAELAAPAAIKIIAKSARDLRLAIAVGDVAGMNDALAALKASAMDTADLLKLQYSARAAQFKAMPQAVLSCLTPSHSFPAGTEVVLADGSVKPIEDVRVGDVVLNAVGGDPGATLQQHRVDQIHVTTTDTDFTELTIDTAHGPQKLVGTQNHPFYDLTRKAFVTASQLAVGDRLQTADSSSAVVAAVRDYTGAMVTYDLGIDDLHTYFVEAGDTPILVHNCLSWTSPASLANHFIDHGAAMGFETKAEYEAAAQDLTCGCDGGRPGVLRKYDQNTGETHFYDPKTNEYALVGRRGIVTYYQPSRGKAYFDDQPGVQ